MLKKNLFFLLLFLIAAKISAQILYPAQQQPGKAKLEAHEDYFSLSNDLFTADFFVINNQIRFIGSDGLGLTESTDLFVITFADGTTIGTSQMHHTGLSFAKLSSDTNAEKLSERASGVELSAIFSYGSLSCHWKAILRDNSHYLRTVLKIVANEDVAIQNIVALNYKMNPNEPLPKVVGNTRGAPIASDKIFAGLETPMGINMVEEIEGSAVIKGIWSRKATLAAGESWQVSAVVGAVAEGQLRRSFLVYHERERAVPWRSFIHYNSWYELNIGRNNIIDKRMSREDCLQVVNAWQKHLFEPYNVNIDAFVWDDGWDDFNSLWDFYQPKFPNGFTEINQLCRKYNVGLGAWLGPVGGYGASKQQRLNFWNNTHTEKIDNFQLSNAEYFNAFLGRCYQMIDDYDMRYFKFDGISDIGNAVGPGNEEDAEYFLRLITMLRNLRGDLFINCTVGTWASPFWFRFADAVWRQDADWSTIGNQGNMRQRWITYRDYMVYKNFVQGSPLCPINSLMTHGLILSGFGTTEINPPRAMENDTLANSTAEIVKEMRCAFACGSAMVELYLDHLLMTEKDNGILWRELADCIRWHRANADLLADTHWVGGNPWDGEKANLYGWAAWNGGKAMVALRNPSDSAQHITTTLRNILEIPNYISGKIFLTDAFSNQIFLSDITNQLIDIDAKITFVIPPFEVVVLDGVF